jgi:putative oxidoreductase
VTGKCGDIDGVWIDPVIAQVMMTFRASAMVRSPRLLHFAKLHHKIHPTRRHGNIVRHADASRLVPPLLRCPDVNLTIELHPRQPTMDSLLASWTPRLLSVLRIVTAFMFMMHGVQKWFGFPTPRTSPIELWSLSGVAGLMELVGGFLLLIGLFSRPVAFLLSGEMAFAYFIAHAPQGFWPGANRGELAALYSFVFLYLAAAGGGPWSIDRLWRRD